METQADTGWDLSQVSLRPKNYVAEDGLKLLLSSCLCLPSDERPVLLYLVYLVLGLEASVSCVLSKHATD